MRHKARTILTIIAIFIGSATMMLNFAINNGVDSFISEQTRNLGGEDYILITPGTETSIVTNMLTGNDDFTEYGVAGQAHSFTKAQIEDIKKIPGIDVNSFYTPKIPYNAPSYIYSRVNKKKYNFTYTVVTNTDDRLTLSVGKIPSSDNNSYEILLPHGMVSQLGFENDEAAISQPINITYQNPKTHLYRTFVAKVVGVSSIDVATITQPIISRALEDAIFNFYTEYSPELASGQQYYIRTRVDLSKNTVENVQKIIKDKGFYSMSVADMMGEVRAFFEIVMVILIISTAIALVTATIGIVNTLLIAVEERTREIGLNKALGMSSFKIFRDFSMEVISLGFWGSLLGVGAAFGVSCLINSMVHAPGQILEMFPTFELCVFDIHDIIVVMLGVMLISLIAGTTPAWRAAHKNPIEALRYE